MRQRAREQLSAFIARTRHGKASKRTSSALAPPDPQQHFTPQRHGLSEEQCRLANQLLRQAERERPLRGDTQQRRFRYALRCGGILSAVRNHRVGRRRFGRSLQGHHGGNVMRDHALHHLRHIAPIGHLASMLAHDRRQAAQYYEEHGQVLLLGAPPTETMEQQRLRSLQDAWEAHEWQQQRDRLPW